MSDFTIRARETAEREARRRWPHPNHNAPWTQIMALGALREGYVSGQAALCSRLPSEEEIAKVIAMTDEYDGCFERIEAWEAATIQERECGEVEEPLSSDQEDCEFWLRRARAVRELIEKKMLN